MSLRALCLAAVLAGCAAPALREAPPSRAAVTVSVPAGPMRTFASARPQPPARANAQIAQDILDLVFTLESGRAVPRLTRFAGPVTVHVAGPAPSALVADLAELMDRLRREAGLPVALGTAQNAVITVVALPHAEMQRAVPNVACFVVPQVTGWADFLARRNSAALDWTRLDARTRATIFVPADLAPQELRDCLHEELAQALGPLNDLYRLPDSVFNDDNMHTILTGFDMLVLRALYDPGLQNGMDRAAVAARLPAILNRINPAGARPATASASPTPRAWAEAMGAGLRPGASATRRRDAAARAVQIARQAGWADTRAGFAWYTLGRLQAGADPAAARASLAMAEAIYAADPATALHRAHVRADRAALAGLDAAEAEARAHQDAALLATILAVRAGAFTRQGDAGAATAARLDSAAWARYGFGSDAGALSRLARLSQGIGP